ncbi:MAG: acetolactate synthase small subunit [Desulfuromonadales bacterium]
MTVYKMKRRTILAFVQDKPGTLNKISMMIRRKMYNVDTLTVCKAKPPGVSRMTITLREDDEAKVTQVIRQLEKFTEVIRAKELDRDHSYWREVAIVKFELDNKHFEKLQKKYQLEILDSQPHDIYIVQIAGPTDRLDGFLKDLGSEHLIEIARTGVTALEK